MGDQKNQERIPSPKENEVLVEEKEEQEQEQEEEGESLSMRFLALAVSHNTVPSSSRHRHTEVRTFLDSSFFPFPFSSADETEIKKSGGESSYNQEEEDLEVAEVAAEEEQVGGVLDEDAAEDLLVHGGDLLQDHRGDDHVSSRECQDFWKKIFSKSRKLRKSEFERQQG